MKTFTHSAPFTPFRPPCNAMAAPVRPAINAWLSLVGMPKYQAATAQMMMANSAAHRAIIASPLPLKFTMFFTVMATVALSSVITSTPKKLNTADISTAALGVMARVATTVAMALGASVQPFTNTTPKVSRTVTSKTGLFHTCVIKDISPKSKAAPSFLLVAFQRGSPAHRHSNPEYDHNYTKPIRDDKPFCDDLATFSQTLSNRAFQPWDAPHLSASRRISKAASCSSKTRRECLHFGKGRIRSPRGPQSTAQIDGFSYRPFTTSAPWREPRGRI